jgi:hypothetical protein
MSVGSIISKLQSIKKRTDEEKRLEEAYDKFMQAETNYYLYYKYKNIVSKSIIYDYSRLENDIANPEHRPYDFSREYHFPLLFGKGVIKEKIDIEHFYFVDHTRVSDYKFFVGNNEGKAHKYNIMKDDIIGICNIDETAGFNQNNAKLFLYD